MLENCLVITDITKKKSVDTENSDDQNEINCMMHETSQPPTTKSNVDIWNTDMKRTSQKLDLHMLNIPIWNYDDFVLEYLNEGFFGTVYKARHVPTDELLVLKLIKNKEEEEHYQSFIQEVCLLCRLKHQNVTKIKGITFADGQLCCLSEYIEIGCLQDFLNNENGLTMSWLMFLNITLDISRGMLYIHQQGVIHRDLNSKNILLREIRKDRYEAIIIDFGLSYQQPDLTNISDDETPSGPAGSPFHIAPELFNGKCCSKKSDIFSFGIILCEMISDCPGADPDELPRSDDFGLNVEEFSELVSDCPAEFLNLAVRCCQVKPEYRPHFSDIMKIVDIIIDRCIEHSFENVENLVITPRDHDISISGTGHDEYILDHCLLCSCEHATGSVDDKINISTDKLMLSSQIQNIAFKETYDRFGGVLRTGSRKLMRKYFKRCNVCGGRLLNLDCELQDDEIEAGNHDNLSALQTPTTKRETSEVNLKDNDTNDKLILEESERKPCSSPVTPHELACSNYSTKEEMHSNKSVEDITQGEQRTRSPPHEIPDLKPDKSSPSESETIPSSFSSTPGCDTLERVPTHQAASLLRHMDSDISTRTSQLAQQTPGRLPRFFNYIMRRRKGNHHLNKDTEKRGSRLSLHKLFNMKSTDSSSPNTKNLTAQNTCDISAATPPNTYHGRRRFTFSKHKHHKEEYERRRLSMPIADRDCVSGSSSPVHQHAPSSGLTSKSLKCLSDLESEDNCQLKLNSTHKKYSSHYKGGGLATSKKHSRSLVDLLFRKKNHDA